MTQKAQNHKSVSVIIFCIFNYQSRQAITHKFNIFISDSNDCFPVRKGQ